MKKQERRNDWKPQCIDAPEAPGYKHRWIREGRHEYDDKNNILKEDVKVITC